MAILLSISAVLFLGIVPMVAYALILWWLDRYEKEPLGLLAAAFLWGAVPAIVFSLITEFVLHIPISFFVSPVAANLIGASVVAPLTEEISKGVALVLLLLFFRQEIDSPLDGIVYGRLVGFGFAAVENVLYFTSAVVKTGMGGMVVLSVFRAFVFGANHALFTGLFGLGLASARMSSNWLVKISAPTMGLLSAMAAHGVHNFGSLLGAELYWPCLVALLADWGGVLALLSVAIWVSNREQRWIVEYLQEEVGNGALSEHDYQVACSYLKRAIARTEALLRGDLRRWWQLGRYYRLVTELAFSRRRLIQFRGERETHERIIRLHQQLRELEIRP